MPYQLHELSVALSALPPLPQLAHKLLKHAAYPDVSIENIVRLIQHEPVITVKVLSLANSAYYSPSHKIDSLNEAILLIGITSLRMVILTSISDKYFSNIHCSAFKVKRFWRYCIEMAYLCQFACEEVSSTLSKESAYLVGLLHHLGLYALSYVHPKQVSGCLLRGTNIDICIEKQIGYPIGIISGLLLKEWGLPENLHESITQSSGISENECGEICRKIRLWRQVDFSVDAHPFSEHISITPSKMKALQLEAHLIMRELVN